MPTRFASCAPCRSWLRGGVVGCFLLAGSQSAPCTSSSVVKITVDSTQAAGTAVETVSCTGGVFSLEWVGSIALPNVFNISGGTIVSVYGGSNVEEDVVDGALATQLFSVADAELNLEGVTLTGGFVESSGEFVSSTTTNGLSVDVAFGGAAIYASNSVVTMADCVASGNVAENGGAVFLKESYLGISGVTAFTDNEADGRGGAIFAISNSTITVEREAEADFSHNSGSGAEDVGAGGAIDFSLGSTLTVLGKATFHDNSARLGGAVKWGIKSFLNVTGEVDFTDNAASTGGALHADGAEGDTSFSLAAPGRANFFKNTASDEGGAFSIGGDVMIGGEVNFTENFAGGIGGAISGVATGRLELEETTVARFTANECVGNGGAISLLSSTGLRGRTNSVQFVDNVAGDSGGAIYAQIVTLFVLDGRILFAGNAAANSGGAVHASVATDFDLANGVEFRNNSARVGGAVVVESSVDVSSTFDGDISRFDYASISNTTFFANAANEIGGALHVGSGFTGVSDSVLEGNIAGRFGGALSISGVLEALENCTFLANSAPSGPAVFNFGTVRDENAADLEFESNSLVCDDGQFIDYVHPVLTAAAAASPNASGERYMVDCDRCPSWDLCTNCSVLGDVRTPACAPILDHTTSLERTGTLETLDLESGYWRATNVTKYILSCFNEAACQGGAAVGGYCATGYQGPYCAVCEEDYNPDLSYGCNSCLDGGGLMATAVLFTLIAGAIIVAILLHLIAVGEASSGTRCHGFDAKWRRLKTAVPFHSLRITVVSWQIITQISEAAQITYPAAYERFLAILSVSNFNLAGLLSAGCLISTNFFDRLLISTLGPIAVLVVLACTYHVATWRNRGGAAGVATREAIVNKHASMMLLVAFLAYGSVSGTVFATFPCELMEDGIEYLRADYSIQCGTHKHNVFMIYALFMIIIFPIGIPAVFAVLLFSHRHALVDSAGARDDNPSIRPFADLWQPYRPEWYTFELVECLRRVLATDLIRVFVFPSTDSQIVVNFMAELLFFVVSVFLLPYKTRFDNWMSHIGHVMVLMSLNLTLLVKANIAFENHEGFAGVLVAVHCFMILSIIAESTKFFGRERSGTNGSNLCHKSPTRELQLPLPRSSRSSSAFAIKAATEEEEEKGKEDFETFAEFQRRQGGVQIQPVSSSISALDGVADTEKRPSPLHYQPRQPASPHG